MHKQSFELQQKAFLFICYGCCDFVFIVYALYAVSVHSIVSQCLSLLVRTWLKWSWQRSRPSRKTKFLSTSLSAFQYWTIAVSRVDMWLKTDKATCLNINQAKQTPFVFYSCHLLTTKSWCWNSIVSWTLESSLVWPDLIPSMLVS